MQSGRETTHKALISLIPRPYLVSRASRIFLYFRWEEREGEKNTSGHSGQLPVPRRNVTSEMIYHRGGEPERAMHC